uniref:Rod_C domain-containing protein n=1 Tax=Angiostrongylus cantonensis TaxID=6313 RepID=A0A0K0DF05_ANGCA
MRYSAVVTDFGDEETKCFNKHGEFANVSSLYEVKKLATISGDLENDENEEPGKERTNPSIITEGNEKWLAIAVEGTSICGVGWIGSSGILAVLSSTMEMTLLSANFKALLTTITLPSTSHCKRAYISSDLVKDLCYVTVAREDGETFIFEIPEWFSMESANGETIIEACKASFGNSRYTRTVSRLLLNSVVSVGEYTITVPKSHAPLQLCQVGSMEVGLLGAMETAAFFTRVRYYSNGRFIIGLTLEGLFVVYDLWTYSIVLQEDIRTNQEEVFTDFIIVNNPGINLKLGMIAVIVKTQDSAEMHIRSLLNSEITYRVGVSPESRLIPVSEVADRVILLVESFAGKDTDTVKVREIVEAQPEMKLERLISRNQFDQAEQFAIQFNLDVQKVHVARMHYLLSLAAVSNSDEHFAQLMNCLENVNDHNMVGEVCFSGATTFGSYERIISLLTYSRKRAITDPATIDHLAQVSYLLATYRLVQGPENAGFASDSLWKYLVSGMQNEEQWHQVFLGTLKNGSVKEARVVWNRHIASITPCFNTADDEETAAKNLSNFFEVLRTAISKDIGIWRDAIAFLEFDFVPAYLWKVPKQISTLLVDFLLELARELETLDRPNFPLNSLHATSTFERIIQKHVNETVTGTRQTELAYVGSLLCADASGTALRLRELDTYSSNLKVINRLKEVYQCPLSYSTFVSLNCEEICFQILQQCLRNPNLVKENVEKYARRYMAEHNLEQDGTLYKYVEAVSSSSPGLIVASNAWHDHCLIVCETIHNFSVRCKAICMIATRAQPPWNKRLSEAVESVLNNRHVDQSIRKSLEAICRRAELSQIMLVYSTPFIMLDPILENEYKFVKFIRFMFIDERYNITQRLADALKDLTLCQFLENLRADRGSEVLDDVVSKLIDTWKAKIDSAIIVWTESAVAQRIRLIAAAESVILRFMSGDSYYMEVYEHLCSIRKLQEDHGMYVITKQLENKKWREDALKNFIVNKERSLLDIFSFSNMLGMSRDEASCLSIKLAVESGNSMGAITVIRKMRKKQKFFLRDALRSVPNASHALVEACVHGCEFVLWCLQESAGKVNSTSDPDIVGECTDSIIILSRVLPILEPVTNHSLGLLEAVTRMHGYVDIFLQVVKQCMLDDTTETTNEKESGRNNKLLNSDECRIYGVRRRVGVYQMRNEGPLFARMEAIASVASVARSVVGTENLENEVRTELHMEQATKWNDFFNFLSLSNQDLLEFQARVYSTSLACWEYMEDKIRPDFGLRSSVRNVCLRAMQAHPCDLWTPCTLLSSLLPSVVEEIVLELRSIIVNRKSPQTMINFLRIVQFSMILTQSSTHAKMLTVRIIYVDEFCGAHELPTYLLKYAIELVQLASSSNDECEVSTLLEVAYQALKVNEVPISKEKSFVAFREVLYTVSPYNYAVLVFIISHLDSTCDDENREFVTGCLSILDFLIEYRRHDSICKVEVAWYINREKQMANDRKDPNIENFGAHCRDFFENGTRPGSCNTSVVSFIQEGKDHNLYEQDVMVAMPDENWQALLRSVPWLKNCSYFSRSRLLSIAVGTISAEVIANGEDLSSHDLDAIKYLLMHASSRNAVVNCVAMCFKNLPLCETKIRLMEVGRDVAEHWLTASDIEPSMDRNERVEVEEQVNRLNIAIERYNTELILKKNGLYNEKTCDLIESPADLVCHIYSNSINWKSENERLKQMAVVDQLARANHITNLAQIQENLVVNWLIADKVEEAYSVDPNDTMGNAGLDAPMNCSNEDEIFLSPFFDIEIDRIVYVLKLIDMEKIMPDLISYMRREASNVAGGFRTIVRAACVLLRAYTDEQLKKVNYDHLKICVDLDAVLYGRLLDLAHVDIPLDTFRRQEKSVIVRGLVAPGARWTPQLAFLVASLIIDNEIADCSVVEMVLNRLQSAQKREIFVTLLNYCRQEKKLHRVQNLARLWARAAEWSLSRIDNVKDEFRDEFERWFYFAISCPVDGGRAFDSIRNILRERNYVVAAYLIGVIGSCTQRSMPLDFSTVDPERDLILKWTRDAIENIVVEK